MVETPPTVKGTVDVISSDLRKELRARFEQFSEKHGGRYSCFLILKTDLYVGDPQYKMFKGYRCES